MNAFTPKYVIIQNYIMGKINNGEYKVGDRIPSENELSVMFNVSRITSNKALSELEVMGIVERVRGKGTYVKSNSLDTYDFSHILSKSYKIASETSKSHTHKLMKVEKIKSNDYIAAHLNTKENDIIYKITRIMLSNNEVLGIDYSYIPLLLINGESINENKIENVYIHDYLKYNFNVNPKYLHVHIDTKYPDVFEKKVLNIIDDIPVLIWEIYIIDDKDRTIALTSTVARSDKYRPFINFEL